MTNDPQRLMALLVVVASLPVLQGAGCSTHHSARLYGTLHAAEAARATEPGKPILVIYRRRNADTPDCTKDWGACLRQPGWEALHACDATEGDVGKKPVAVFDGGATDPRFDACTGMIGVDYRADLAAFVDGNGNGKIDAGEPYGVYAHNPFTREGESAALPLEIAIDQVLAP
jgi:hypothetical protein